jgi:uncharacterized protein
MKFTLFRKHKEEAKPQEPAQAAEQQKEETAIATVEPKQETTIVTQEPTSEPTLETVPEPAAPNENIAQIPIEPVQETKQESIAEPVSKTYLKAMPLKDLTDIENVKNEIKNGNIIILRVTPLANKSIEDVKTAVNQLYEFAESVGGDIARLGEERVVICPKNIRIWREKSPVSTDSLPTSAPTAA